MKFNDEPFSIDLDAPKSVPLTSYGSLTEPKVEVIDNRTDGVWKVVGWMLKALIALTPFAAIIILNYIF